MFVPGTLGYNLSTGCITPNTNCAARSDLQVTLRLHRARAFVEAAIGASTDPEDPKSEAQ